MTWRRRGAAGGGVNLDSCDRPDVPSDDRRWRPMLTNSMFFRRSPGGVRFVAAFVWLLFIVFPLLNAVGKHGTPLGHGLVIGGAALFVASYVTLVVRWRRHRATRTSLLLFAVLLAVSAALTLTQASGWGFLFTYCAACAAFVAPVGLGLYAVATCAVLAAATSSIGGADGGTVLGFVASSAGIGLLMLVMSDLRLRNEQLSAARAELARMAVAEERERFARDLHDLLGHSLSVIALKAELAGRMLANRPDDHVAGARLLDQAATEVSELEQVARTALGEVRDAVSGYRQPTLDGELAGARMALSAAGIEADVQRAHVPLDPAVEAVLAWTVREGATNVIRHSGARHCTLRITASLTDAGVEVIDDGAVAGAARGRGSGGGGLGGGGGSGAGAVGPGGASAGGGGGSATPGVKVTRGGGGESAAPRSTVARGAGGESAAPRSTVAREGGANGARSGGPDHAGVANGAGAGLWRPAGLRNHPGAGGHGIAGLAERARLLNGTLEAGALPDGGYRLAVTVPVSHA